DAYAEPIATTVVPVPFAGVLSVTDGCAHVVLTDGSVWADSCLPPSLGRPRAVVSEPLDAGDIALIRVFDGVTLVSASEPGARFDQRDGWLLLESPTTDFAMTVRTEPTADEPEPIEVVCDYNPLFIDCDEP